MKFEVGDVVKLTKTGWTNSFHRDSGISPGAVAIVKAIMGGSAKMFACEFFPPARSTYLHGCSGACACHRGRWMFEYEIESASLVSANIAELFEEV